MKIHLSLKKAKLRTKIFLPIITLQLLILVGMAYILGILFMNSKEIQNNAESGRQILLLTNELINLQKDIETNVFTYRFNKNHKNIGNIYKDQLKIAETLDKLHPYIKTPQGKNLVKQYIASRTGIEKIRTDLLFSIQNGNEDEVKANFNKWNAKTRTIDASLRSLTSYRINLIDNSLSLSQFALLQLTILTVAVLLGTFILILFLYLFLQKTVTNPISQLSLTALNFSRGKFRSNLHIISEDEIGQLALNLKEMGRKLQHYYKNLEEQVKIKEEQLRKSRELEDRKNEFISAASHELKTPLTSQKVYVQLLQKHIRENRDKKYAQYIEKIAQQTDKLTTLVSDLLDVSKIQAGKLVFQIEKFDLNALVKEVVEDTQESIKTHAILINGAINKKVYGDKERIGQVLSNLLSNAVKYSPDANKVIVSLRGERKQAIVCIQDFGIGIQKKHQQKIFDRFYRVTGSDERTYPGLGMGLFISHEIIQKHRGKIWVESKKGKGSKFYFTLPQEPGKV